MTVQGQVRFQGIADAWIGEDEAEVTIEIHAIPPLNLSGPDTWDGDPIVWSIYNATPVDDQGRFAIALSIPDATSCRAIHASRHEFFSLAVDLQALKSQRRLIRQHGQRFSK